MYLESVQLMTSLGHRSYCVRFDGKGDSETLDFPIRVDLAQCPIRVRPRRVCALKSEVHSGITSKGGWKLCIFVGAPPCLVEVQLARRTIKRECGPSTCRASVGHAALVPKVAIEEVVQLRAGTATGGLVR